MGVGNCYNLNASTSLSHGVSWVCSKEGYFKAKGHGDSKVIIDWVIDHSNLQVLHLEQWARRVDVLKEWFIFLSFAHIYRDFNLWLIAYIQIDYWGYEWFDPFEEYVDDVKVDTKKLGFL